MTPTATWYLVVAALLGATASAQVALPSGPSA